MPLVPDGPAVVGEGCTIEETRSSAMIEGPRALLRKSSKLAVESRGRRDGDAPRCPKAWCFGTTGGRRVEDRRRLSDPHETGYRML